MDWLNNAWVVGILSGIPSGLLVTLISRYLLGKREDREYLQKVLSANREVIYALRPHVSEGLVPASEVVDALIASTARRFGVTAGDLYSRREIAEDLIKEVMDSSFISASKKEEYCKLLTGLAAPIIPPITGQPEGGGFETMAAARIARATARTRTVTLMSTMAGVLTALMSLMVAVAKDLPAIKLPPGFEILLSTMLAVLAVLVSMAVTVAMVRTVRRVRRSSETIVTMNFDDLFRGPDRPDRKK